MVANDSAISYTTFGMFVVWIQALWYKYKPKPFQVSTKVRWISNVFLDEKRWVSNAPYVRLMNLYAALKFKGGKTT